MEQPSYIVLLVIHRVFAEIHSKELIIYLQIIFTWNRTMQRKNIFEYFLNCSKRNFGRNVNSEYLLVLIRFDVNFPGCGPLLIVIIRLSSSICNNLFLSLLKETPIRRDKLVIAEYSAIKLMLNIYQSSNNLRSWFKNNNNKDTSFKIKLTKIQFLKSKVENLIECIFSLFNIAADRYILYLERTAKGTIKRSTWIAFEMSHGIGVLKQNLRL